MLVVLRGSVRTVRLFVSVVDSAIAAGALLNAHKAARESALRRREWTVAQIPQPESKETTSVA